MIGVNKDKDKLELRVYGFIGDGWFADVNANEMAYILDNMRDVKEIDIRIHSPGGSVAAGTAIYNALKNHKAKKNVYIEGECCSIATVIAMAGDEIVMSPVATFMIHDPLVSFIQGGAEDLRNKADTLDTIKKGIISAYKTKSKLSEEEISNLMKKTTYFSAQEALDKGFITKIEEVQVVNGFKPSYSFQNIPEGYFNIKNNKEENNMPDIKNITKEELKIQNRALFDEILNEGATQERERIKGFEIWENKVPAAKDFINDCKYKNYKHSYEVSEELLNYIGKTEGTQQNKQKGINPENFEKTKNEAKEAEVGGNVDSETIKAQKFENDLNDVINYANK